MPQSLPPLPTSIVGSLPQPDWLIDREKLAHRFPPRVRARELVRTPRFAHLAEALLPVLIERGELDGETARAVLLDADRVDVDLLTERTAV